MMMRPYRPKFCLFYGTALTCSLLALPAASSPVSPRHESRAAAGAPYSNPYNQRRAASRAQLYAPPPPQMAAPAPAYIAPAPPRFEATASESEPLKIVIPNPETVQPRHVAPPLMAAQRVESYAPPPAYAEIPPPPVAPEPARGHIESFFVALTDLLPDPSGWFDFGSEETAVASSADGPIPMDTVAYKTPGVIIKHETLQPLPVEMAQADPTLLAAMAPAAGANEPNVPLIQLPDGIPIDTAPVPPLTPLTEPAAPAAAPPAVAAPPPPQQSIPPLSLEEIIQKAASEPPAATTAPPLLPRVEDAPPSEPPPELSQKSKDILKKVPGGIDAPPPRVKKPIDIDHAKNTEELFKDEADDGTTASHESMGMKVEIKNRKANWDYELEKAYTALIGGHSGAAIDIYKGILTNDPKNKSALFGLATSYHRAGQIDMARPLYGQLLAIDPDNRDALNNFLVLMADEAPESAIIEMEKLESRNPNFSAVAAQLAVIYQKLGQTEKASEKMFRAIMLAPENLTYRYNLAIMLDKQRKFDEAAKLYRQIVEAYNRGEVIPGNIQKIQERLTFISSNRL